MEINTEVLFLPQRPLLTTGSLSEQVTGCLRGCGQMLSKGCGYMLLKYVQFLFYDSFLDYVSTATTERTGVNYRYNNIIIINTN